MAIFNSYVKLPEGKLIQSNLQRSSNCQHFWQDRCGQTALARAHEWGTSGQGRANVSDDPSTSSRMSWFGYKNLWSCWRARIIADSEKSSNPNNPSLIRKCRWSGDSKDHWCARCSVQQRFWPVLFRLCCKTHTRAHTQLHFEAWVGAEIRTDTESTLIWLIYTLVTSRRVSLVRYRCVPFHLMIDVEHVHLLEAELRNTCFCVGTSWAVGETLWISMDAECVQGLGLGLTLSGRELGVDRKMMENGVYQVYTCLHRYIGISQNNHLNGKMDDQSVDFGLPYF